VFHPHPRPPSVARHRISTVFTGLLFWLSQAISAADSTERVVFLDVTEDVGIDFIHRSSATSRKYMPETMGSGVALLDFDGDGRLDIFFANGAAIEDPMLEGTRAEKVSPEFYNRLYRQRGNGTFEDVTLRANVQGDHYSTGVAVGDYDNDGFPDLFVGGIDGNRLYRNRGDGAFLDVTDEAGVRGEGWASSVAFVDYDHDGLLDIIVGRYLDWSFEKDMYCGEPEVRAYCSPDNFDAIAPILFRNEGRGRFSDVSVASGVAKHRGKALGIGIADIDRDGYIDIFIANDGMEQFLLRNNGDGTFEEVALFSGVAMDQDGNSFAGMGVDVADFDNDGLPDILVTNLSNQNYALYRNEGDESFTYASDWSGLSKITLLYAGWGLRFIDHNNDGWRDIFITQGHVLDTIEITSPHLSYAQPPFLLKNLEGKSFVNISAESGEVFSRRFVGRGLAVGDLDNDGDLDVVLSNLDSPAIVLRNQGGNRRNWIMVDLTGTKSNRDGIGAEVTVTLENGLRQFATVTTTSSYQSASDRRVHFGLGDTGVVKELKVRWPSGIVQRLVDQPVNRILRIREAE
jgi:enediyne biosynthesis protein E4